MTLRWIRRIVQLGVLSFLLLCWLDVLFSAAAVLPWLPHFSPLMAAANRLNRWQWTPFFAGGVLVAFAALLFPRFFCGWICPLGTCIDVADTLTLAHRRKTLLKTRWWTAPILCAGLLAAAALGWNLAGYLDPLTIMTHTLAYTGPDETFAAVQRQAGGGRESLGLLMSGIAAGILLLTVFGRRTWCRLMCPMGGMLGMLSRAGMTHRQVSSECIHCGKCSRACKMGAISRDGTETAHPSCIYCNRCVTECPRKAVEFR